MGVGVEWGAGLWVAGRSRGLECHFAFSQKRLNNEKERKMFSENPLRLKAGLGWRGRGDSTRGQKRYSSEHRRKREGLSLLCAMWGVLGDSWPRLVSQSRLFYLETQSVLVFPTFKAEQ